MSEIRILAAHSHTQWDDARGCLVPMAVHKCDRCGHAKPGRIFEVIINGQRKRYGLNCLVKLIEEMPEETSRPVAAKPAEEFWEEDVAPVPSRALRQPLR